VLARVAARARLAGSGARPPGSCGRYSGWPPPFWQTSLLITVRAGERRCRLLELGHR
jgi:hypothetical protein